MSSAKQIIEKKERYQDIAFKALIEIGAIKTCDYHEDFYYSTYECADTEIYAKATSKLKEKYGETQDYKLFHEIIGEILSYAADSSDECPYCQKLKEE